MLLKKNVVLVVLKYMNTWIEYIRLYELKYMNIYLKWIEYMNWIYIKLNWIGYMNWIYIKLLHKQSKGEISMWGRSSVTDIRIVHVFVLSYTPYFHIVEWSTGDSKQDRYSHRITMHVVTSDSQVHSHYVTYSASAITKIRVDTRLVLIPIYALVRVVQNIPWSTRL